MTRELLERIEGLLSKRGRALVGIEGMSASGKTTLAAGLAEKFPANIYHMDDYYLPAGERPENWMKIPAGNMDIARFSLEVLHPLARGESVIYRPFSCAAGEFAAPRTITPRPLEVVEGAYCMHPALSRPYDITVFMRTDEITQKKRILSREGLEGFKRFETVWIPMEARYFAAFNIESACDIVYEACP